MSEQPHKHKWSLGRMIEVENISFETQDRAQFSSLYLCDCGAWKGVEHILSQQVIS